MNRDLHEHWAAAPEDYELIRDHKNVIKRPPNANKKTAPPIIAATINTFLLSKSPAITTPTHS